MRVSLLHGFAGDPSVWDDTIAAGLDELQPTAIALPGHGLGAVRATWGTNLDAVAAAIDGDVVVGYSLGARVALGLVVTRRIERAILIGVNPGLADETARAARRTADAQWARLLRERGIDAFLRAWEEQPLFATQQRVPAEHLAARRARRLALDPEQLARSLEVMGLAEMPDYRPVLATGNCALIAGADDTKFAAIARSYDVMVRLIEGAGHDVLLEQPAALAATIRELATPPTRRPDPERT